MEESCPQGPRVQELLDTRHEIEHSNAEEIVESIILQFIVQLLLAFVFIGLR